MSCRFVRDWYVSFPGPGMKGRRVWSPDAPWEPGRSEAGPGPASVVLNSEGMASAADVGRPGPALQGWGSTGTRTPSEAEVSPVPDKTGGKRRCPWGAGELEREYHDSEWGVPLHDDRSLFEFLVLEGAQAGLSWSTILKKHEAYRRAFAGFDPLKVARFGARDVRRLLSDPGIVRNRRKIESAIANAGAFLAVQKSFGSFDAYLWTFVGGRPRQNRWRTFRNVPAETAESKALSKDLKKRGFTFVGPTICYAFMQAVGMVNDHLVTCFRHSEIRDLGKG